MIFQSSLFKLNLQPYNGAFVTLDGKSKGLSVEGMVAASVYLLAVDCGIVNGYDDGSFRPDRPATREELAAFLFRMAEYYGLNGTTLELPDRFSDKDDVSVWAVPALEWAVDWNIMNGLDEETLAPQGNASRAQLATMLYRFELSLIGEA